MQKDDRGVQTPLSLSLSTQLKRKSTGVSGARLPVTKPSAFEEEEDVDRCIADLDPKTREALESVVKAVVKEGPQAEGRAKLNHKSNPAYWFLFGNADNPVTKLYRQKLTEFRDTSISPCCSSRTQLIEKPTSSFIPFPPALMLGSVETNSSRKRKSRWNEGPPVAITQSQIEVPLQKATCVSSSIGLVITPSAPGLANISTLGSMVNFTPGPSTSVMPDIRVGKNSGKAKHEYDSDEETEGGTWEHKKRKLEMEKTKEFAEKITSMNVERHHLGDFLPPDELARFMGKCKASVDPSKSEVDKSDYVENKLGEDNKGFQLLRKMGWKDGSGLGSEGQGIVAPINKGRAPSDLQGLGAATDEANTDPFELYRAKMMLAYRYRPNPLNNPRRPYY